MDTFFAYHPWAHLLLFLALRGMWIPMLPALCGSLPCLPCNVPCGLLPGLLGRSVPTSSRVYPSHPFFPSVSIPPLLLPLCRSF